MVAFLERSDENVKFHHIVNFLTTSSIHYALTVSPTIHASYIEQFWATAKSKTVNDVKQIHATVDGKTMVILESSVRSDLYFNDEDGITCLSNDEIFVNLVLIGGPHKKVGDEAIYAREDDRVVRAATTASSLEAEQESDAQTRFETASKKSHDPPLSEGNTSGSGEDSMKHQVDLTDFVPPPPHDSPLLGGQTLGSDEGRSNFNELTNLCTQLSNIVLDKYGYIKNHKKTVKNRQARTRESEEYKKKPEIQSRSQKRQRSTKDVGFALDPLTELAQHVTSKNDMLAILRCPQYDPMAIKLVQKFDMIGWQRLKEEFKVLALENSKTAQDLVIQKLKKRVKRLEKALRVRTLGMKLFKIGTSRRKGLDKENVSKHGRKSDKTKLIFNDSDFDVLDDAMENVEGGSTAEQITTTGDTLNTASINVSTTRHLNVSVVGPSTSTAGDIFEDEMTTIADTLMAIKSTRPRTISMVEPEPTPKNLRKAQIQMDEELAQRLFEEEQAQFEKEQRIAREKAAEQEAKDAALIEQIEDVQARIDADELLAERLQQEEREQFTVDEQARMLKLYEKEQKWINDFVPLDSEMVKDSGKEDGDSQNQAESSKKRPRAEHDEESVKKRKLEDEAKREELRACLDIVPGNDIALDFESLATKYLIID
ncbi:hypothetical protein Tco_0936590 [Tanacetum coccineum]|uniref:Xylulose kinase-1 n=1 Tax=Tanacetum coccineum TaxID=301880 RepID=A0ABQ5DBT0_9ASTR